MVIEARQSGRGFGDQLVWSDSSLVVPEEVRDVATVSMAVGEIFMGAAVSTIMCAGSILCTKTQFQISMP